MRALILTFLFSAVTAAFAQYTAPRYNPAAPGAIGGTTPSTGAFTSVTASTVDATTHTGSLLQLTGSSTNYVRGRLTVGPSTTFGLDVALGVAANVTNPGIALRDTGATEFTFLALQPSTSNGTTLKNFNASFSTSGLNVASSSALTAETVNTAGLYLRADANAPIVFGSNGVEVGRWATGGELQPKFGVAVTGNLTTTGEVAASGPLSGSGLTISGNGSTSGSFTASGPINANNGLSVTGNISATGAISANGPMRVASQPPASASATGVAGTITYDADYIYVCVATDTWKRVAIATW